MSDTKKFFRANEVIVHGYPVENFDPKKQDELPPHEPELLVVVVVDGLVGGSVGFKTQMRFARVISTPELLRAYLHQLRRNVWEKLTFYYLEPEDFEKLVPWESPLAFLADKN